ncbi:MAG: hypothetical protein FWG68_11910, partial [Defluviitaleaceae bacterium]|nr:hypothetical protein [Defluviitaleaceae bacterium]
RIISAHGGGAFSVQYSNIADSDQWLYSHKILTHLMQNGTIEEVLATNYAELFAKAPFYLHEYAVTMQADWFSATFVQSGIIIPDEFRQILVIPPTDGITATVIFVAEDGYSYKFSVAPTEEADFRHNIYNNANNPYYTAENGVFVRANNSVFYGVSVQHPYADIFGFSLNFVQDMVSVFFRNPATIRTIVRDDSWVFRDVNTVVVYHDTNILEYINYRAIDRSRQPTFLEDYSAAIQFILQDALITNDFYLAGFTENSGTHTFYFNFTVDNMPVSLPNNWPADNPLQHAIIVTVDHATVVRYRKLAVNFYANFEVRLNNFASLQNHIAEILGAN